MSAPCPISASALHSGGKLSKVSPVPRLALSVEVSCAAVGVSCDFSQEHVAPEVRVIRRGHRKLIAVAELQRWLDKHAERVR